MFQAYPGADYYLPNDEEEFKKAMMGIKQGDQDAIKNYKQDINHKILWYGNEFCPEQSLLSAASQYGRIDIVNKLINMGAKIDDQDEYGSTPLHYACFKKNIDIIEALLDAGADINKKAAKPFVRLAGIGTSAYTGTYETPLHNACAKGNLDVVKYLVSHGAVLDSVDHNGKKPIDRCVESIWHEQTSEDKNIIDYLNSLTSVG